MKHQPTHLGRNSHRNGSLLSEKQIAGPRSILDVFPNPKSSRDYEIKFVFPEFTSMCPVTGQPDFATITVAYIPAKLCVEMKSLKLYFMAYRNKGIFYESVVNTILDDLVAKLKPRKMTVIGEFANCGRRGRRHGDGNRDSSRHQSDDVNSESRHKVIAPIRTDDSGIEISVHRCFISG